MLIAGIAIMALVAGAACGVDPADSRAGEGTTPTATAETSRVSSRNTPAPTDVSALEDDPSHTPIPVPPSTPEPPAADAPSPAPTPVATAAAPLAPVTTPTEPPIPTSIAPQPPTDEGLRFGDEATELHALALEGRNPGAQQQLNYLIEQQVWHIDVLADVIHPDGRIECCWTPLHLAALNSFPGAVSLLMKKGADVNARTGDGWTPCALASGKWQDKEFHRELCPESVRAGDRPAMPTPTSAAAPPQPPKDLVLGEEVTDLHRLALRGKTMREMRALVAHVEGQQWDINVLADLVHPDGRSECCWTPLHLAAVNPIANITYSIASLLLSRGADVNAKTGDGWTACALTAGKWRGTGGGVHERLCPRAEMAVAPVGIPTPAPPSSEPLARPTDDLVWVKDGVGVTERFALQGLEQIQRELPALAKVVLALPWVADGMDRAPGGADEFMVLTEFRSFTKEDAALLRAILDMPWFVDGLTGEEIRASSRFLLIKSREQKQVGTYSMAERIAASP